MPKPNSFYTFLSQINRAPKSTSVSSSSVESIVHRLEFDKSESNAKYVRIPLSVNKEHIGSYIIKELHISVYEDLIDASPYHLTARLIFEGKEYALHVYFSNKDALIGALTSLHAVDEEGLQRVDLSDAEKTKFHQFAMTKLAEVTTYRLLQHERIEGIKDHIFNELERMEHIKDTGAFFKKTEEIIHLSKELDAIGGSRSLIEKIHLLIKKLDWDITDSMQVSTATVSIKKESKESKENKENNKVEQAKAKKHKAKHKAAKTDSSSSSSTPAIQELEQLKDNHKALHELEMSIKKIAEFGDLLRANKLKEAAQAIEYNNAVKNAISILKMCEAFDIDISCEYEIILFRHLTLSHNQCLTLLEQSILSDKIPEELSNFVRFLRPDFIRHAVSKNKPRLLNWLLSNGPHFDVNKINLKVKHDEHCNVIGQPLLYAFERGFLECFKVLLNHNAFLGTMGLKLMPIIFQIWSEPETCPDFFAVINTLENRELWINQAIKLFNDCLSKRLDKEQTKLVKNAVQAGREYLKVYNDNKSHLKHNPHLARKLDKMFEGFHNNTVLVFAYEDTQFLDNAIKNLLGFSELELSEFNGQNVVEVQVKKFESQTQQRQTASSALVEQSIFPKQDEAALEVVQKSTNSLSS